MDISIHALRGEDDLTIKLSTRIDTISIHALRGEDDPHTRHREPNHIISIHALRGEDDAQSLNAYWQNMTFQSTPSVGRTTEK